MTSSAAARGPALLELFGAPTLRRVGRQAMEFDAMAILAQPALAVLARPPGRPRVEPAPGHANVPELLGIAVEMLQFIKRNPGCVQSGARDRYADCFRRFVLEQRERHAEVAATEFAAAIDLPLGTLEDWLRSPPIAKPSIASTTTPCDTSATDGVPDQEQEIGSDAGQAQIETVLAAWRARHGGFDAFCAYVRRDHRLAAEQANMPFTCAVRSRSMPRTKKSLVRHRW